MEDSKQQVGPAINDHPEDLQALREKRALLSRLSDKYTEQRVTLEMSAGVMRRVTEALRGAVAEAEATIQQVTEWIGEMQDHYGSQAAMVEHELQLADARVAALGFPSLKEAADPLAAVEDYDREYAEAELARALALRAEGQAEAIATRH